MAAIKIAAVTQRGAKKDFVDVYALASARVPLSLIDHYRRKYSMKDRWHVLRSLVYFADADRQRMPLMLWDVGWRTIKTTIRGWVKAMDR